MQKANTNIGQVSQLTQQPFIKEVGRIVEAQGDGMDPIIRHKDKLLCKEITDKRLIIYGDIYYIEATNGLETCRYVNVDPNDENRLLLYPFKDDTGPSPLYRADIAKLYKVIGLMRNI